MFSIGLVLSAGGSVGDPWHAGVLDRLLRETGWNARDSDLVVGTSAGAITATSLRAGLSPSDLAARHRGDPAGSEAEPIFARITTPWAEVDGPRDLRPTSPRMSVRAFWPPWRPEPVRAVVGATPRGRRSGAALGARTSELTAARWPELPTWIVAVRGDDGRRIVFGRDDVRGDIGEAVRASAAIPGVYEPVRIGEREYVDGAVHSSTNADLVAPLGFDMVVVSSCLTVTSDARSWKGQTRRTWFGGKVDAEVAAIRRRGTAVLVVEPRPDDLELLDSDHDDSRRRAVAAGDAATAAALDGPHGEGVRELLARAGV